MPVSALALYGFLDEATAAGWLRYTCVLEDQSDPAIAALWSSAQGNLGLPVANAGLPDSNSPTTTRNDQ